MSACAHCVTRELTHSSPVWCKVKGWLCWPDLGPVPSPDPECGSRGPGGHPLEPQGRSQAWSHTHGWSRAMQLLPAASLLHVFSEGGCPSCSHGSCLCPNLVLSFAANSALPVSFPAGCARGLLFGLVLWPLGTGARLSPFPAHASFPQIPQVLIVVNNSDC